MTKIASALVENVQNDENLFPLRDSNQISQESSMPVGLPVGEKKGEHRSRTAGANHAGRSSANRKQFGSQGHPRLLRTVPFDRRRNLQYFLFPGPYAYRASFWSYGEKNEISENESWFLWQRPLKI